MVKVIYTKVKRQPAEMTEVIKGAKFDENMNHLVQKALNSVKEKQMDVVRIDLTEDSDGNDVESLPEEQPKGVKAPRKVSPKSKAIAKVTKVKGYPDLEVINCSAGARLNPMQRMIARRAKKDLKLPKGMNLVECYKKRCRAKCATKR